MVVFLTDIFDSPSEWAHKTKTGGTNKIKAPYLNLIGATTPDWIAKAMPLDTVGIGLTSRIVFVFQDTPRVRPAFPTLSTDQMLLHNLLVEDLVSMGQISGEYQLTPEAKAMYEEWYQSRIEQPNSTGDPRLNGYYERKPIHLLKLAMIIAASFRDETVIEQQDLVTSLQLFDQVELKMTKVFANVGKNPLTVDYDDIEAAIAKSGGAASFAELMGKFKHSVRKEELAEVIDTLVAMNKIVPGTNKTYTINKSQSE